MRTTIFGANTNLLECSNMIDSLSGLTYSVKCSNCWLPSSLVGQGREDPKIEPVTMRGHATQSTSLSILTELGGMMTCFFDTDGTRLETR
jgi:hypothetical protein